MLDVSIRLAPEPPSGTSSEQMHLEILYVTHDIASACYFADDTLVMYAGRMVEGGDSETVTQHPAHPYTRLLIESAPDPDRIDGSAKAAANAADGSGGEPPSLIAPPSGCRFHPRCPFAMAVCAAERPAGRRGRPGPGPARAGCTRTGPDPRPSPGRWPRNRGTAGKA